MNIQPTTPVQFNDLIDTTVFITGGGSGIGAALVSAFCQQGAKVAFISLEDGPAQTLCRNIEQTCGQRPLFIKGDICQIQDLQSAICDTESALGPIAILINNAGDDTRHSVESTNVELWDNTINTNLRPHFFSAQCVLNGMKALGHGSIINLGSNASLLGLTGYPAYVAAKAGILGLTKALAREFGEFNIRVNALVPGWVMTEKQKRLWVTPKAIEECLKSQSLKRLIEEEDIVYPALFLASKASSMISGQSIVVDGGRI